MKKRSGWVIALLAVGTAMAIGAGLQALAGYINQGWLFALAIVVLAVAAIAVSARLFDDGSVVEAQDEAEDKAKKEAKRADWRLAWCVGLFLVGVQVALTYLAAAAWLAPDQLFGWFGLTALAPEPSPAVGKVFQDLVLSACAAGLGGGVFMLRGLYLAYCYGNGREQYFQNAHALRYVLLPIAAFFLGPVILSLLAAGAIGLTGAQAPSPAGIPRFTIFAVSFVLGFAYHDTLKFLADLSWRILGSKKDGASAAPNQ